MEQEKQEAERVGKLAVRSSVIARSAKWVAAAWDGFASTVREDHDFR